MGISDLKGEPVGGILSPREPTGRVNERTALIGADRRASLAGFELANLTAGGDPFLECA